MENFNFLSNLFKEYTNSGNQSILRMQSASLANVNIDNMRNEILEGDINENEQFSEIIKKKLDDIKKNSISKFEKQIKQINEKYDNYKNIIMKFISDKEKRILDLENPPRSSKGLYKYASQNIFKKMNNSIQICSNIINNIENNFELLNTFLMQNSLINYQNQIENFLIINSKLIEKCSILNKFNITELDTTNLNKIDYFQFYIKYLSQKKFETNAIAQNYTLKKNDLQNGIAFLMENFSGLKKLKLEEVNNSELLSILENIGINISKNDNRYKLTKFYLENFGTLDIKFEKNILNQISKLKVKKGTYANIPLINKVFIENNNKLSNLSLEYINMTDIGFKSLLLSLIKNPSISNTLEYLSLEGNRITMVKYEKEFVNSQNNFFQNLKTLNLSKNGIYKFEFSIENNSLPKLKFLDLTSNNIPTGSFMEMAIEHKSVLVLLNDNMFITNSQNNNNIYIKYLTETLPKFDSDIKSLNLNFTFDKEKQEHLSNLKLSQTVLISLINLDLSFCGISTDKLVNFISNNPKFLSLRYLNLRYNNIQSDFFEKILSNKEICLDNINFIDLSENEVVCSSVVQIESLGKFIEKNNNLENIQLINSGFFTELINQLKDNNPNSKQFKDVFLKLKEYLEKNKREFKFITNEGNNTFVKKEFQNFFNFKF